MHLKNTKGLKLEMSSYSLRHVSPWDVSGDETSHETSPTTYTTVTVIVFLVVFSLIFLFHNLF